MGFHIKRNKAKGAGRSRGLVKLGNGTGERPAPRRANRRSCNFLLWHRFRLMIDTRSVPAVHFRSAVSFQTGLTLKSWGKSNEGK